MNFPPRLDVPGLDVSLAKGSGWMPNPVSDLADLKKPVNDAWQKHTVPAVQISEEVPPLTEMRVRATASLLSVRRPARRRNG